MGQTSHVGGHRGVWGTSVRGGGVGRSSELSQFKYILAGGEKHIKSFYVWFIL